MLRIIKQYGKFKDIYDIRETEVVLSCVTTIVLCIVLNFFNIYSDFHNFINLISSLLGTFIGGYLGMIGFALSGMAIMLGLFSKMQINKIEKRNGKGVIEKIMSSYAFFALVSAINIILLLIVDFALSAKVPMLPESVFWIFTFAIIYLLLFNMFYAVALVFNCISLFSIGKLYTEGESESTLSIANEIRIDYLLNILTQICGLSRNDVLDALEEEAINLPENEKDTIKKYFDKHYAKE